VHMAGNFTSAGGAPSCYHARLDTTCAGSVIASGSGCLGSGGPNLLQTALPPWVGSTWTGDATGMPAGGLALGIFGLQTASVPLPTILPQGQAGCELLVAPDLLQLLGPVAGAARSSLTIPNDGMLLGFTLHHQVAGVALAAGGGLGAVTSTNRLTLTLGTF
ncbi:MAG: hypothetical protein AB8H80_15110, partial [Planctomycetota bacterium]